MMFVIHRMDRIGGKSFGGGLSPCYSAVMISPVPAIEVCCLMGLAVHGMVRLSFRGQLYSCPTEELLNPHFFSYFPWEFSLCILVKSLSTKILENVSLHNKLMLKPTCLLKSRCMYKGIWRHRHTQRMSSCAFVVTSLCLEFEKVCIKQWAKYFLQWLL